MRKIGFVVLLLACAGTPAQTFDCAKAGTQVERTICADPKLKQADDDMGAAFKALKARLEPDEAQALVQSQRVWLASRNDCAAFADCLLARTQERTRILDLKAPGPGTGIAVIPHFRSQAGSPKRWSISYSAFRLEPPLSEAFSAYLKAGEAELPFVEISDEDALPDGRLYVHDERIEPTYLSGHFLSALDAVYVDSGGAHGNYGRIGKNFDLKKDAEAVFSNVFTADAAAKLVPQCVALIAAEKKVRLGEEAEVDATAVAGSVADLNRWSFSPGGAKVMFDPYEVGSYAEGEYDCAFTGEFLGPLLKPDSPVKF